jgi:hypothetical protein
VRIRQLEFISLAENRILLIIVTTGGDVQNRLLLTRRSYTTAELNGAAAYLNEHLAGLSFEEIRRRLGDELRQLRSDMTELMDRHVSTPAPRRPRTTPRATSCRARPTCSTSTTCPRTCRGCANCSSSSSSAPACSSCSICPTAPRACRSTSAASPVSPRSTAAA